MINDLAITNASIWKYVDDTTASEVIRKGQVSNAQTIADEVPYYRKLTLHEIKVLEINANLMGNEFRINKTNAKEEVEFHCKGN